MPTVAAYSELPFEEIQKRIAPRLQPPSACDWSSVQMLELVPICASVWSVADGRQVSWEHRTVAGFAGTQTLFLDHRPAALCSAGLTEGGGLLQRHVLLASDAGAHVRDRHWEGSLIESRRWTAAEGTVKANELTTSCRRLCRPRSTEDGRGGVSRSCNDTRRHEMTRGDRHDWGRTGEREMPAYLAVCRDSTALQWAGAAPQQHSRQQFSTLRSKRIDRHKGLCFLDFMN